MYYGHMGFFGGFGMILFWGAFIWLIIWLLKQNMGTSENPIETLKKRYAKGEITKKELDEMRKELNVKR